MDIEIAKKITKTALASTLLCFSLLPGKASAFCIDTPPIGDGIGRDGAQFCSIEPGCDYSDASQNAGFGWNPLTAESCPPIASETYDHCDYSYAAQNRGWGWDDIALQSCPPIDTTISRTCDYSDAALNLGYGWNDAEQLSCAPLTDTSTIDEGDSVFVAATLQDDLLTDGLQAISTVSDPAPVSIDQTEFPAFDQFFDIDVDANSITFTTRTVSADDTIQSEPSTQIFRYFIGFTSTTPDSAILVGSEQLTSDATATVLDPGFVLFPDCLLYTSPSPRDS